MTHPVRFAATPLDRGELEVISLIMRALLLFAVVLVSGCGYHFGGLQSTLPLDIHTVSVLVFENQTTETGIQEDLANNLISEFTRGKMLDIADEKKADAILTGVIKQIRTEIITHTAAVMAAEHRVYITLDVQLKRSSTGQVLWRDQSFSEKEEFQAGRDSIVDDSRKKAALRTLAQRAAEKIHDRIFQGF
ncbi:MAG: LptE family protein [Pseudomonadota bacterium]